MEDAEGHPDEPQGRRGMPVHYDTGDDDDDDYD